jgi:hypothetical protein
MESYIIRIYRRDSKRRHKIEGVVERVGISRRLTFHSFKELRARLDASVLIRGKSKAKSSRAHK